MHSLITPIIQPLVSVIIPAYNVEEFVADSIQSVLSQRFEDFELIVVVDGATDNTLSVVSGFTDPRIRILTQANRGLAGARNTGIRSARGQYIAFLDADDRWHADKLFHHVEHLSTNPLVGISYSSSQLMEADGTLMSIAQNPKLTHINAAIIFKRNPIGNGSAPVIRKAVFDHIAYLDPSEKTSELWYFDERFRQSEDIDCWMQMALTTHWQFEGIAQPLTYYRVNSSGLSAVLSRQLDSWEKMVDKVRALHPAFAKKYEHEARGYQYRYLARRALSMGNPSSAWTLLIQALKNHPKMIVEEPIRTAITVLATITQRLLSPALYHRLANKAMNGVGYFQQLSRLHYH